MNRCPQCHRGIPDDAAFCIHCAAQLRRKPQTQVQEPATGATIRLNPAEISMPVQPAQSQPTAHKQHTRHNHRRRARHQDSRGPLFVIGVLMLLLTNTFWPGILLLLGLMGFMHSIQRGRSQHALKQLLFYGGMALLFWTGRFWPGILLLIFASHLFSGSRYGWRP